MIDILINYRELFTSGFLVTIKLFIIVSIVGVVLGTLLGAWGSKNREVESVINGSKFLTKVIPFLVILFWFHYPLQQMLGIVIDPFWTATLVFCLLNTIAVSYLVLNEIKLVPKRYIEIATALGVSQETILKKIQIPLVFKRSFPEILLQQSTILEYTLFASLISVPEIFRVAQNVNSMIYDPVSVYSLLIIFFVIILTPLHLFIRKFKENNKIQYV